MIITSPKVTFTIHDYDIVFNTGMVMTFSLNPLLGDSITIGDNQIDVRLVGKPSLGDPDKFMAAEDTTLFTNHVASIVHRTREVVDLNPEQKHDLAKTLEGMTPHPTLQ